MRPGPDRDAARRTHHSASRRRRLAAPRHGSVKISAYLLASGSVRARDRTGPRTARGSLPMTAARRALSASFRLRHAPANRHGPLHRPSTGAGTSARRASYPARCAGPFVYLAPDVPRPGRAALKNDPLMTTASRPRRLAALPRALKVLFTGKITGRVMWFYSSKMALHGRAARPQ